MYLCIVTPIGSSPLFFFIILYSLSYGGFNWFKNSIFKGGGGSRGEKWPKPCMHIWIIKKKEFYIYSYRESISTTFIFLVFFFYPTPLICDLPLVWSVFHYIAVFVLGLYSTCEKNMQLLALWAWLFHLRWCSPILSKKF
jgi:hypothetical protein